MFSVVYEWLKKKQGEGVEVGWKDGGPGASPVRLGSP
jgi:hypothetical protein